jgi:hypothetical protein
MSSDPRVEPSAAARRERILAEWVRPLPRPGRFAHVPVNRGLRFSMKAAWPSL